MIRLTGITIVSSLLKFNVVISAVRKDLENMLTKFEEARCREGLLMTEGWVNSKRPPTPSFRIPSP